MAIFLSYHSSTIIVGSHIGDVIILFAVKLIVKAFDLMTRGKINFIYNIEANLFHSYRLLQYFLQQLWINYGPLLG